MINRYTRKLSADHFITVNIYLFIVFHIHHYSVNYSFIPSN